MAEQLIAGLGLVKHIEGGYFRETYRSPEVHNGRSLLTVIYYLLTRNDHINTWNRNKSPIVHFHQQGAPLTVYLIHEDGRFEKHTLGQDIANGQVLQLVVPPRTWKGCCLEQGEYALIAESVSPGFEYEDMAIGDETKLEVEFPQHKETIWLLHKLREERKAQKE